MKCIYCGTDSTYRERTNRSCKKCKRSFAFEPREMTGFVVTDPGFKAAIEAVSENGTLFFTPRQLYYQLMRPKTRGRKIRVNSGARGILLFWLVGLAIFLGLGVFTKILAMPLALAIALVIIALGYILRLLLPKSYKVKKLAARAPIIYDYFRGALLLHWVRAHGAPPRMLPEGGRLRPALRQGSPESNLQSYSFDRLLVCDKSETVDMLLANNLHFETNTPIVSVDGYPQDIFEQVMGMVRRNPALKVFALHDASPEGCLLPLQLREDARWFPRLPVQVFDIGLRPRQVATMPDLVIMPPHGPAALSPELIRCLTPGELRWLRSGYRAELAAIRPARLMRAIYQNFNRVEQEEARQRAAAENDPRGFFQTALPGGPAALNQAGPVSPGDALQTPYDQGKRG